MNADSPFEGDVPSGGDEPSYEWLDEWLCEYVDGTMDPSLEAVFEQYVEANPELKAHVERLQQTRDLLCNCSLPKETSPGVEAEVCRAVEGDVESSGASDASASRPPVPSLGLVSSVAVALVVGFLVGATVVNPTPGGFTSGMLAPEGLAPFPQMTVSSPRDGLYPPTGTVSPADSAHSRSPLTILGTP